MTGMANTNYTFAEQTQLFEEINDATIVSMIPVIVILTVFMTLGLIGNLSVCYYYGYKIERTASSHFILTLAAFDLVMSAVGTPMEIVDLHLFYTFSNDAACKTLKLIDAFVAIGSLLTLLVIGFDRFRRICSPFKNQIEKKQSKLLSFAVAATSLALSWPTCVLYGIQDINVVTERGTVVGKDCRFTQDQYYHGYLIALTSVYMCIFSVVVIVLLTMYLLIIRAIFKQKKTRRNLLATSMTSLASRTTVSGINKTPEKSSRISSLLRSNRSPSQDISLTLNRDHNTFIIDKKTVKFTLLMLTITALIILGFVPYLALSFWRIMSDKHHSKMLTSTEHVAFQIGIRSVLLNAAINPLVYGLFNTKFRTFWYKNFKKLCCWCCRRGNTGSASEEEDC